MLFSLESRTAENQWRRQEFSVGGLKPGHMASARSVSLYGGLGPGGKALSDPQRVPGAEPLVGSQGACPTSPLKVKALSLLGGPLKALMRQIRIILGILQSHKTTYIS